MTHWDTIVVGVGGMGSADAVCTEPVARDEVMLRQFAERYFPDGAGATLALRACMFTNTPDEYFIVDRHPDHANVVIASPCSGHGYKFASVIGEIVADLASGDGGTRHDIAFLKLDRAGVAA
jgi:sarcosine oxidase